jgi:hypothetical protein
VLALNTPLGLAQVSVKLLSVTPGAAVFEVTVVLVAVVQPLLAVTLKR